MARGDFTDGRDYKLRLIDPYVVTAAPSYDLLASARQRGRVPEKKLAEVKNS